jgi:hypothetical protein
LQGNVAEKRKNRLGWRGFCWDMLQLFDFAQFLFHQMIAFPGPALYRDSGVNRSDLARPSIPDRRFEISLILRKSKKLEKRAARDP